VFPAAKRPRSATKIPKSKRESKSKRQKTIEKRVLYLFIILPCLCLSSHLPRTTSSSIVSRRCVVSRDVIVTILSLPSSPCIIFIFFFIFLFSCHRHRYRAGYSEAIPGITYQRVWMDFIMIKHTSFSNPD